MAQGQDVDPAGPGERGDARPWQDPGRSVAERVEHLVGAMTLDEKLSQLVGLWVGADPDGGDVAPHQADMSGHVPAFADVIAGGLGQLTRPFGTAPVDPVQGARSLARSQAQIVAANRFGIPAQVHDECLAGFAAWQATAYPVPLSWGASFSPGLVEEMARRIGASMRSVGVHQGLAPVLDVTRDFRWGRTEETIGEDPHLVGEIGAAYVRGLESAGVVATLKHFAGYSASRAGRNLAPAGLGPRELADVILPPFEVALREGGARSVMHSYADVDGVPAAADVHLLTDLLRERWGFGGTVVADYYGIAFLHTLHGVAADLEEAAGLALAAGVDVELPSVHAYGDFLRAGVAAGRIDEALVDRALRRVLTQKCELGLLDADWEPLPEAVRDPAGRNGTELTLDDRRSRAVALEIARRGVVLLANDGTLPLPPAARIAVVGPLADDPLGMLGCYSFPVHVGVRHPELPMGIEVPSVLGALRERADGVTYAPGCDVTSRDTSGFDAAVAAARDAEVCVVAVGDRAGLFGRGTSGEGCDASDLRLPGVQADLVRAVLDTGTPVVLLVLSGRPYALDDLADDAAAVVQAFFPGQAGGQAIAEVLTGAVNPSGRLPVSLPRDAGGQPGTYLAAPLGRRSGVSATDPTPQYPFGHGIGYTRVAWGDVSVLGDDDAAASGSGPAGGRVAWPVDGDVTLELTVRNDGARAAADVVQLYLHDVAAQVVQPVVRLVAFARVELDAGASARVRFTVPADAASFTGLRRERIVEPGGVELRVARSSADVHAVVPLELTGALRRVGPGRRRASADVRVLDPLAEEVPA
ncbi:glycoside hydrolase family 3 domain protein [Beutenbergia cavernae DSM 12333]|uniref:Glycoside hydrolase family 3 domain protein n=1 Tax=Beutenbergia cavernae (strain ATCC BAA-8 / DSM 12333 / CCUG 43141 / JCM 11478 / NBRC 16432 / NCIMB 13614 / HKI 0122) TaxID=471853 RepID=C5C1F9_BEUC1|nr:glycoside hydrolase family 3 N-terminal domain-containing protein [Beutenbergia cavernae]ACQ81569.1 glycoside hydrolase family 3 domain protein [Beutenbergia cavernae DSM 12333]